MVGRGTSAARRKKVECFDQGLGTLVVDGVSLAVDTVRPFERVLWLAGQPGLDEGPGAR